MTERPPEPPAGRRSLRLRDFGREIRWTVLVAVLAALAVVALWPRDGSAPNSGPSSGPQAGRAPAAATETDPAELAALRRAADLRPCGSAAGTPSRAGTDAAKPPERLAGVTGTCLADGKRVDIGSIVAAGTTLINVWASWCGPCREELPALQAYTQRPDAVRVLGVQVKSSPADGLALLDELNVHLPTVHDTGKRISAALRVPNVLPTSYLVTDSGRVHRLPPEVFESPDEVEAAVRRALGAAR